MSERHKNYLRDVVYHLREVGGDIVKERKKNDSEFLQGRELAYREVLSHMQHQAIVFGLNSDELCLSGFEADTDDLDPPQPTSRGIG